MDRLEIGKILSSVGLKGELKVMPETKDVNRFKKLKNFYVDGEKYVCERASIRGNKVVIKIENYNSVEEIEKFKNKPIYVDRIDSVKLEKDEYFAVDLVGSKVYFKDRYIGLITEVANYGSCDIIFVKKAGVEQSFVYVEDLVENFDIENKILNVTEKIEEVLCE